MLGYFGPEGTFTHQALRAIGPDADAVAFASVPEALDAVRRGQVEGAVVPIENSVEGGVSATLDALAAGESLRIVAEVVIPVQFGLYARPGTSLGEVRQVLTHGHAAAQCRDWLARTLPGATVTEAGSTAGAAQEVADPASRYDAAVCARVAGELYGLDELAHGIEDNPGAVTRFVQVARPGALPGPTGADKTTLVAHMHTDRPGALLEILDQFAMRGVNLCRIESRPTKTVLGSYCFNIDAEGHATERRVAEALMGLHRVCRDVVFLGSYPRADAIAPTVRHGFSDDEFDAAGRWYRDLTGRDYKPGASVDVWVNLPKDDDFPPVAAEALFAHRVGPDRYRIETAPVYAMGIAVGDVVVTETLGDQIWVTEVAEQSDHWCASVIPLGGGPLGPVWEVFTSLGTVATATDEQIVTVDVPPEVDAGRVLSVLAEGFRDGRWDYQVGVAPVGHDLPERSAGDA